MPDDAAVCDPCGTVAISSALLSHGRVHRYAAGKHEHMKVRVRVRVRVRYATGKHEYTKPTDVPTDKGEYATQHRSTL